MTHQPASRSLILVPAVITMVVTLVRLIGELNRWSPTLFNREGGGGGALVGIVWLVPVFGVYFALKLDRAGLGPASRGRALGLAVAGLATSIVLFGSLAVLVAGRRASTPVPSRAAV